MFSFQLVGLDPSQFEPLFDLTDDQLAAMGAVRCVATETPGFPCRISLEDAAVGDELLLLPYVHQPGASPYKASGPIFVRRGARQRTLTVTDNTPAYLATRLLSVRAYDRSHMMMDAAVCEGRDVRAEIQRQFSNPLVATLHLHNAKPGCFSCQVHRVALPT
jgi:Protein of unknown function (DUF1203)